MKIRIFMIICFTASMGALSQTTDTLFANENYNTTLFFPEKIRQGIVGAPNFVFSYNEEQPQHFGLLKALPGTTSNLLVLTRDGQIYSYFLKYREELPQLNYFITEEKSIGNEVLQVHGVIRTEKVKNGAENRKVRDDSLARIKYFESLSTYYLRTSNGNLKSKKKDRLKLTLKELIYYRNETYMVFELENKSGIDFELNFLHVYLTQGNKKRNASYQKVLKEPVYIFGFPEMVKDQQRKRFVYVLPKFTVGDKEKIEVEVREQRGNRFLNLSLTESMGNKK